MHPGNVWGGSLDAVDSDRIAAEEEERLRKTTEWDRGAIHSQRSELDETQQGWLLAPQDSWRKKKKKYINLGCVSVSQTACMWTIGTIAVLFLVVALPIIIVKSLPRHKSTPAPPDNYTLALHKALQFFDAQKCKSSLLFFFIFLPTNFLLLYLYIVHSIMMIVTVTF